MARSFDGSSQYLYVPGASADGLNPVTNDWSIFFWLKTTDQDCRLFSKRSGNAGYEIYIAGTNQLHMFWGSGPFVFGNLAVSSSLINGNWHLVGVTFAYGANATGYVDGVAGTSPRNLSSVNGNVSTTTDLRIAVAFNTLAYFAGDLCEIGIWNTVLDQNDINILTKGFSSLFVKPQNLITYWPLIRDNNDRIGAFTLTEINAPGVSDHMPKIFYPVSQHIQTVNPPVIGGVFNSPIFR